LKNVLEYEDKVTRKKFLQQLGWLIALPYLLFGWLMIRRHQHVTASKVITLKIPETEGVFFHQRVIVVKNSEGIHVLSSRCTHLGCQINKLDNGKLVCPCHGSSFNENGRVIKGPASSNLAEIPFTIKPKTQELIIKI